MAENQGAVPVEVTPTIEMEAEVQMGGRSSERNAEAWAVGQRGGVDVSNTDQTYHNNSKYYAQQAGGSATAADGSAEDAEAYATGKRDGTDVSSDDPAYHNNAKYYNDQMQAALEEVTRQAVVEAAGNAEAWAVGQRGGADVPSTDPAYHNNAKYYRQMSQGDANAAAGSATAAAGSATTAAGHVTAAEAAQAAAEAAAQEAIDTVVAAQGPGIVYMDENGFYILIEDEEEE